MRHHLHVLLVLSLLTLPAAADPKPNILVILLDDMGAEMLDVYGLIGSPPSTPNIDDLAGNGLVFTQAWSSPVCSPTRANILTGRYGFNNYIGLYIQNTTGHFALPPSEVTLPDLLDSGDPNYKTGLAGKWHLGTNNECDEDLDAPTHLGGFDTWSGVHFGVPMNPEGNNYWNWQRYKDGEEDPEQNTTTYLFKKQRQDAVAFLESTESTDSVPWFLDLAFQGPFELHHIPGDTAPAASGTCSAGGITHPFCSPAEQSCLYCYKEAIERLDEEIGVVVGALSTLGEASNTVIFLLSDNGTPNGFEAYYPDGNRKGEVYQGGIHVPLIIKGPGVTAGETDAMVSATDLYRTIAELAGKTISSGAEDSESLVPLFSEPNQQVRDYNHAMIFRPNGEENYQSTACKREMYKYAVRNARYKLVRDCCEGSDEDELYDLGTDPLEEENLCTEAACGNLEGEVLTAYENLDGEVHASCDPQNCQPEATCLQCAP